MNAYERVRIQMIVKAPMDHTDSSPRHRAQLMILLELGRIANSIKSVIRLVDNTD